MKAVLLAFLVGALVAGCSTSLSGAAGAPRPTATGTPTGTHPTFDQLRNRPLGTAQIAAGGRCPTTRPASIRLGGNSLRANGSAPFYFGPWGTAESAGDFNKTPWTVDPGYTGRIMVRGRRINGPGQVAFGFWPQGFGTPSEQAGLPVVFTRPDQQGRTLVYQPELDIDAPAGGRSDAHFWSFPFAGCYAIQVDGDAFTHVAVITVT